LVVLGGLPVVLVGMLFLGIGYITQELLKVVVAGVLPEGQAQSGVRPVLRRLRRGMADRQHHHRNTL